MSQTSIASLVQELIEIGKIPKITDGAPSERFYWRKPGEGVGPFAQWDQRTREIGEELYRLGGGKLANLLSGHQAVEDSLGSLAAHALSAHWNNIGEDQWREGSGEVWHH